MKRSIENRDRTSSLGLQIGQPHFPLSIQHERSYSEIIIPAGTT